MAIDVTHYQPFSAFDNESEYAGFLGVFNAPKSLPNQPSLDQFCAMHDPDVVDV